MTRPLRDPIIYPGEPFTPLRPLWHRTLITRPCAVGGEPLHVGTIVRRTEDGSDVVCRRHSGVGGDR
jgi:hypothetical protein